MNVAERFVGVWFRHNYTKDYIMRIESGGNHQITWSYPYLAFNDRNIWVNHYQRGIDWYQVRIRGDVTGITVSELGTWMVLLDFYSPGRTTPVHVKHNGTVYQTWNPIQ